MLEWILTTLLSVPPGHVDPRPVDLNTASLAELVALPHIGPTLAARIVTERARRPFRRIEELARVPGIGKKRVARLRGRIAVSAGPSRAPPPKQREEERHLGPGEAAARPVPGG